MARIALFTGIALIVLGVVVSVASDSKSVTSYIPAFIGGAYVVCAAISALWAAANKHVMHAAALISVLAIVGSLGIMIGRGATGWALFSQAATTVIAGVFLVFAIRSFRAVRIAREKAAEQS